MPEDGNELGRQIRGLNRGKIRWIVATGVLFMVAAALLCFAVLAPSIVEDSEVADRESAVDSTSSPLEGGASTESSGQTRNDRIRQRARGELERHQMAEGHAINRSKATELKNEWVIDINPQIDEFAQARTEWENLIGGLLVSDDGKRLAQDLRLLEEFIELYRKRPMQREWADAMREQLGVLHQPIMETIPKKFSQRPSKELVGEISNVATIAVNSAESIKRDISILRGLVMQAPQVDIANAPTLAEAVLQFNAQRDYKGFSHDQKVKKEAAEDAKQDEEEKIRIKQQEAMAIAVDLNERADELSEISGRLSDKTAKLQEEEEKLKVGRVELEATQGLVAERKREIFNEIKQAVQYATPSREDLEASAKRGFAIANYLVSPASPGAQRRGGVFHKQYNSSLIAPRGTEPCQIWKSADGYTVFVHSEGETIALSSSDVGGIVYPTAPVQHAQRPTSGPVHGTSRLNRFMRGQ